LRVFSGWLQGATRQLALGIKQLSDDPWTKVADYYKAGDLVTGKITNLAANAAFIDLQHGINGFLHTSKIRGDRVEKIKNLFKVGQLVVVEVISVNPSERRLQLSFEASKQNKAEPGHP
jgi:small subunit ribosomal protein S1